MFRPARHSGILFGFPFRLVVSVLLILAFVVSVLLLFSLEHEKFVFQGVTDGKTDPTKLFPALWQSRQDLISISIMLFLLSAIAITAVVTYLHYDSTRRTLEEVKGLARNILQSIPTGVLTVNRSGLMTAVNPAAEAVLRRSATELLGKPFESVFPEGDMVRMVLHEALHGSRHVDQKDLPYEPSDGQTRTLRVSTAELQRDAAKPTGVLLLIKDVTEWLALECRIRTAEKLSALHTLSAGVAHELRNPLSAADLNLHLLEEELRDRGGLSPKASKYFEVLNAENRRLTAILDNFMKFARPGSVRRDDVDVRALIDHLVSLLKYEAEEKRIRLDTHVEEPLMRMCGDETHISQVLLNILVNAFQAMPQGGVCSVEAGVCEEGARDWIQMTVRDTGVGIKDEELPRLFDPFFTTKSNGGGLGLAIAYRIVQDHGGTIEVASQPGGGTTVVVKFPTVSSEKPTMAVER